MNKVKITYAIDLEEVPPKSQELVTESYYWLSSAVVKLKKIKLTGETEGLRSTLEKIDGIRRVLASVDQRLDDCTAIIQGYHQAVLDLNAPPQESPDPKDFEIMNEQIRQIEEQSKILAEKGGDDE